MPHLRPIQYLRSLTLTAILFLGVHSAWAQEDEIPPLPMDPEAVTGTLDNGLSYIIRRNTTSPGRADLTFAVKVGSSVERADEAGFSNLLSQMVLQGTKRHTATELAAFFSARGLSLDQGVKATVTYDETLYTIHDFPTGGQDDLSDLLGVIRGWSNELVLDSHSVEEVCQKIIGEIEAGDSAESRIRSTILERVLPIDHPYGLHTPVGNPKVLRSFSYQSLRDFYAKWYRPDLQGIIVVGDIDPRKVERRLKATFGNIPEPNTTIERTYPEVPEHHEPNAIVITDRGIQNTTLLISWAHTAAPAEIKASAAGLLMDYNTQMISMMMEARLQKLIGSSNSPILQANFRYTPFLDIAMTEDAYTLRVTAEGTRYQKALETTVRMIRQTLEKGFSETEYREAESKLLERVKGFVADEHLANSALAKRYTNYFTRGGYAPGVDLQSQLLSAIAEQVTLETVNKNFRLLVNDKQSLTIVVVLPQKRGMAIPSGNTVLRQFGRAFHR